MVGACAIPIAHAGDGVGSTRVIVAFNNAYGLKATIGRLEHMASTKKLPIPINIYGIHVHGPGCGHEAVPHGDHIDYLVDGHLHHPHGDPCDDHGPVEVHPSKTG